MFEHRKDFMLIKNIGVLNPTWKVLGNVSFVLDKE